jgi:hypothetical protein
MLSFSICGTLLPLILLITPWWWIVPIGILFGVPLARKQFVNKMKDSSNEESLKIKPQKLIVVFKTYGYYTRLILVPWRLGWYHPFLWGTYANATYDKHSYKINGAFWVGLGLFLATLGAIYVFWGTLLAFGLIWYLLGISLWLNFFIVHQQISERYCYLPSVGLMLVLAQVLVFWPISIPIVLTFYITRLWFFIPTYRNDYWNVEHTIFEMEEASYAWIARGVRHWNMKDFSGALLNFQEAQYRIPWDFKANFNCGTASLLCGKLNDAEHYFKIAEKNFYNGKPEKKQRYYLNQMKTILADAKERSKKNNAVQVDLRHTVIFK